MAEIESTNQEMPKAMNYMASVLERVAETNDLSRRIGGVQKISIFDGLTRPTISVQSYMERIFKYANCSPSCFIVAYIYLDRFSQRQPLLPINSFNVHRLLITSVLVSAKFMDDMSIMKYIVISTLMLMTYLTSRNKRIFATEFYNNSYYAKVGGISTREMNLLEVDFLFGIGFQLNVTPTMFHTYCSYLQTEMLRLQTPPIPMPLRNVNKHCCINDDDSTHQHHELSV